MEKKLPASIALPLALQNDSSSLREMSSCNTLKDEVLAVGNAYGGFPKSLSSRVRVLRAVTSITGSACRFCVYGNMPNKIKWSKLYNALA